MPLVEEIGRRSRGGPGRCKLRLAANGDTGEAGRRKSCALVSYRFHGVIGTEIRASMLTGFGVATSRAKNRSRSVPSARLLSSLRGIIVAKMNGFMRAAVRS